MSLADCYCLLLLVRCVGKYVETYLRSARKSYALVVPPAAGESNDYPLKWGPVKSYFV